MSQSFVVDTKDLALLTTVAALQRSNLPKRPDAYVAASHCCTIMNTSYTADIHYFTTFTIPIFLKFRNL